MKYMEKTPDKVGRLKFKLTVLNQTYVVVIRASSTALLMLLSDLMVNYMLKTTQRYCCGMHGMS